MKNKILIICCVFTIMLTVGYLLQSNYSSSSETTVEDMQKVKMSFDYPEYDSFEGLTNRADTIIKGKVLSYEYRQINIAQKINTDDEKLNPGGEISEDFQPYTVFIVEISKVFKGNVEKGETIEIKQPGGIFEDVEYVNEDAAKLQQGNNYVLFLETYEGIPASLLNPIQASYRTDENDKIVFDKHNKLKFDMSVLNAIKNDN